MYISWTYACQTYIYAFKGMLLVTFLFNIYRHFIVVTFVNVLKLFSEVFTSMVVKVLGSMSNRKYKKNRVLSPSKLFCHCRHYAYLLYKTDW